MVLNFIFLQWDQINKDPIKIGVLGLKIKVIVNIIKPA